MSSYKLSYFDIRGKAEIIRLIFAQTGVEYEDIRIGQDEWRDQLKQSKPETLNPGFHPYINFAINLLLLINRARGHLGHKANLQV